jgi:hypothetical protein
MVAVPNRLMPVGSTRRLTMMLNVSQKFARANQLITKTKLRGMMWYQLRDGIAPGRQELTD